MRRYCSAPSLIGFCDSLPQDFKSDKKKGNYPVKSASLEQIPVPERTFPKHGPTETMTEITGFRDRGAAKHFHGRKTILEEFQGALAESIESKGGTILLVQGPPGVGKTALLAKCWDIAKKKGWDVRNLPLPALWNPDRMRKCLGLRPKKRTTRKGMEAGGKLGGAGVAVEGKFTKSSAVDTSVAPPPPWNSSRGGRNPSF